MNRRTFLSSPVLAAAPLIETPSTDPNWLPSGARRLLPYMDSLTQFHEEQRAGKLRAASSYSPPAINGSVLEFPAGVIEIRETIELGNGTGYSASTISSALLGKGMGAGPGEFASIGGTHLRWRGAAGQPMIRVNGPVPGIRIENMTLDCAGVANGIEATHAVHSRFANLQIIFPAQYGIKLPAYPTRTGLAITASANDIEHVIVSSLVGGTADAFWIGGNEPNTFSSGNHFTHCGTLGGRSGWRLTSTDYQLLTFCYSYFAKWSMWIDPAPGTPVYPSGIYTTHFATEALPYVSPGWAPFPNPGVIHDRYHREYAGGPTNLESSWGPQFPMIRGFSGNDTQGRQYSF